MNDAEKEKAFADRARRLFDDSVSGYSITGPLTGVYGEPGFEMILRVHTKAEEP